MPKKAYLANHFNSHALKQKYLKSQDSVESRRWGVLWKVSLGWTIKNSALALGIDYQYAKKIVKRYNELGAEGVKNQRKTTRNHRRGKPPLLNDQQLHSLIKALKESPSDGGIWTGPKVARWIEKETQVEKVGNQRGWDYLKKCGYSWQRPRPKHRACDEKSQQEYKRKLTDKSQTTARKISSRPNPSLVF